MSFSTAQFRAYMQTLAERHVSINHTSKRPRFYEMGIDQILTGNLNKIPENDIVLILEPLESAFIGQDPDHQIRVRRAAFIVVKNAKNMNFTEIGGAYDECEEIGDDLIRKMNQEAEAFVNGDTVIAEAEGIVQFDDTSVENFAVGPILISSFGVRYSFNLQERFNMINVDETKWQ